MFSFEIDVVAITVAVIGALGFLYQKVVVPFARRLKQLINASVRVAESATKIDVIYTQMFTNGGGTMRDAINRIENRIAIVEKKQSVHIMDTPHALFESDQKGKFTTVNRTFCRWVNMSESELIGNGWINAVHEHERDILIDLWRKSVENEVEFRKETKLVSINDDVIEVTINAKPMRGADGSLLGYIGSIEKEDEE